MHWTWAVRQTLNLTCGRFAWSEVYRITLVFVTGQLGAVHVAPENQLGSYTRAIVNLFLVVMPFNNSCLRFVTRINSRRLVDGRYLGSLLFFEHRRIVLSNVLGDCPSRMWQNQYKFLKFDSFPSLISSFFHFLSLIFRNS
jgi:hypothetical protein